MNRIDQLSAPLFVSWQLTRDCDLCCLHCCTESAPGKRLRDELSADEAMALAEEIIRERVPYVMLCGGEPLRSPRSSAARASSSRSKPTASVSMQQWPTGSPASPSARCRSASTATRSRSTSTSGRADRSLGPMQRAVPCVTRGCHWRSPSRRLGSTFTRRGTSSSGRDRSAPSGSIRAG